MEVKIKEIRKDVIIPTFEDTERGSSGFGSTGRR